MCNRYISPSSYDIESFWGVTRKDGHARSMTSVYPRAPGPFIRRTRNSTGYERELVVGQWGLIPWFAKTPKLSFSTNNARSEELADKASYRDPWKRGQRCIIPAASFDEPNWETGRNIWWQFHRADGGPWGLAGLWNIWTDKATGEIHESYTMLTLNADDHALMRRMHKPVLHPETKEPLAAQDKRSVISIEASDVDLWLAGTVSEAKQLLRLSPVEVFRARPMVPPSEPLEEPDTAT